MEAKNNFYLYRQNYSGGMFDCPPGLAHYVFIEAPTAEQANDIANTKGIYFDGVDDGIDCDCCGDRWRACTEHDAIATPSAYGGGLSTMWQHDTWVIHYADGQVQQKRTDILSPIED